MNYLVTIGSILALLVGFVIVERITHRFAHRHPEFGPPRKLGCGGCGDHCEGHCKTDH